MEFIKSEIFNHFHCGMMQKHEIFLLHHFSHFAPNADAVVQNRGLNYCSVPLEKQNNKPLMRGYPKPTHEGKFPFHANEKYK